MKLEAAIVEEVAQWSTKMRRKPNLVDHLSKGAQNRMNRIIPEKVHNAITVVIKNMIRSVLFGAQYTVPKSTTYTTLAQIEAAVDRAHRCL